MKKTKLQKGITLVALIITIVVLLILASVTVATIQKDGIISNSNGVAEKYNNSVGKEEEMLEESDKYLDTDTVKTNWSQNGTKVTSGKTTVEVGDYVNYISGVSGYNDKNGWRVLGVENGHVLLLSTSPVTTSYKLNGEDAYFNGITKLDAQCAKYGEGKYAIEARSINANDINKVTGYSPLRTGEGKAYAKGEIGEYGITITYSYGGLDIQSNGSNGAYATNACTEFIGYGFVMPDGKVLTHYGDYQELSMKSTYYHYYPTTLTTNYKGAAISKVTEGSNAYSMLFGCDTYWLATTFNRDEINQTPPIASFGMMCMSKYTGAVIRPYVTGEVLLNSMPETYPNDSRERYASYNVRAVVKLDSNVTLTEAGANSWTLGK